MLNIYPFSRALATGLVLNHEDHEEKEEGFYGICSNLCELRVLRGDKYIDPGLQNQMHENGI